MTIIKKKSERAVGYNASYFFTKKVVQKIRIEGSRCRSDLSDPCSHSSLFLFALGLKDGNRRILDCFPPYCNKPHFFPNPFPSFFPSNKFLPICSLSLFPSQYLGGVYIQSKFFRSSSAVLNVG